MVPFVTPPTPSAGPAPAPAPSPRSTAAADDVSAGDGFAGMIRTAPDSQPAERAAEPAECAESNPVSTSEPETETAAPEAAAPELESAPSRPIDPAAASEDPELLSLLAAIAGLGVVAPVLPTDPLMLSISQVLERESAALLPISVGASNMDNTDMVDMATAGLDQGLAEILVPKTAPVPPIAAQDQDGTADADTDASTTTTALIAALAAEGAPPGIASSTSTAAASRPRTSNEFHKAAFDGLGQGDANSAGIVAALAKQADAALTQKQSANGESTQGDPAAFAAPGQGSGQAATATRTQQAGEAQTSAPNAQPNSLERAVANQVSRAVIRHSPTGGDMLVLRLTPPELGTVRIEFTSHHGVLTARMVAEDDAVRRALDRALPQMKADLRNEHATLEIHVDKGDQRWGWQEGGPRQDQRDQRGNSSQRRRDGEPAFSIDGVEAVSLQTPIIRADPVLGSRISELAVDALA